MAPDSVRKPPACVRCRQRKVKCDALLPACSNCLRARVPCEQTSAGSERQYILQLEARVRELEVAAAAAAAAAAPQGPATTSPSHVGPSPSTPRIGPDQPLAHEVGLLSLQASQTPKYLGPSSGVAFARLASVSAPQAQGLATVFLNDLPHPPDVACASALPPLPDIHRFIGAYFEAFQHLYPFLDEHHVDIIVERCTNPAAPTSATAADQATVFLLVAIGSGILEAQLGADFASAAYLAAAMKHVAETQLHESLQGVQIKLLLVLSSFCFPNGPNAWFLTHTILASCLDLGLQRRQPPGNPNALAGHVRVDGAVAPHDVRSGIFWSAYSLDRTLCTTLGRPLTLRDEAIDVEFPGQQGSEEIDLDAIDASATVRDAATPTENAQDYHWESPSKRRRVESLDPLYAANMSFRFDRLVAEIKLMIHRVAQSPKRFPWPTNLEQWQKEVHGSSKGLLEHARRTLLPATGSVTRSLSYRVLRSLELKHHQCVMLMFRPSPAFPRPSSEAFSICMDSATKTIAIYFELHRFGQMMNSWLTAHSVFVSGITMLYCLWVSPAIRDRTGTAFTEHTRRCSQVLEALGKTWSVANDARSKFDRLAEATEQSWRRMERSWRAQQQGETQLDSGQLQHGLQPDTTTERGMGGNGWADDSLDALFDPAEILADQLGDVSGWFDLDWFECGI